MIFLIIIFFNILEHILLLVEKSIKDNVDFDVDSNDAQFDDALILTEARNFGNNILEDALIETCKTPDKDCKKEKVISDISPEAGDEQKSKLSIFSPKSIVSNVEWLGRTTVDITNTIIPGTTTCIMAVCVNNIKL